MKQGQRIHFIGIGGIGMSGIARVLLQMGWEVSGSDLKTSSITEGLEQLGATVFEGHKAGNVAEADIVVYSSAIPNTNPEVVAAHERGLPLWGRAEMLGYLMRNRHGIAIAGTHGKTTTTSMVARVLDAADLRPTVIIGGEVNDMGGNAKLGLGPHLVAEADESDASFLSLDPKIAVVTNMDSDVNLSAPPFVEMEFDFDKTMEKIEAMFEQFMESVPSDGLLVLCHDHPGVRRVGAGLDRPKIFYGLEEGAELTCRDLVLDGFGSKCEVILRGELLGELNLKVPGKHNVQNALAAIAVGLNQELSFETITRALAEFEGVQRRFQVLGNFGGVTVVDDYAHNPQKIQAALHAARASEPGRVIGVFQPHRYTRTKFLAEEFAESFSDADILLVTDIYSAGEVPIVGTNARMLIEKIGGQSKELAIYHTPGKSEVIQFLVSECRPGDVVVTLGAGDIGAWGKAFSELLHQDEAAPKGVSLGKGSARAAAI